VTDAWERKRPVLKMLADALEIPRPVLGRVRGRRA
jgi:hypothetical protein